ncbi:MAG TPA: hypothetical protein VFX79_00690 [Candidatus Saccharimonadales bacterium]|nr:hypothetical protein [Candidatus Saccharimonadales bacterium]
MVKILYGKPVAEKIDEGTAKNSNRGKIAILLPDEPSSASYRQAIEKKASKLNIEVVSSADEANGVIGETIDPAKDIDCQTPENLGKLFAGVPLYKPATAEAVIQLLKYYDVELPEKNIVVIGRSTVVGKPLAHLLLEENATVTICHSKTKNISRFTKIADIIISAAGKPGLVTADMVNENSIVIDVGTNFVEGKMVGDVDFENVSKVASAISPVPGGVGPVTTSVLLSQAAKSAMLKL